jgi:hypothetical protein
MKNFKYANFDESNPFFDNGPEEPNLCALRGYDDCETCFFRMSSLKRITQIVQMLRSCRRDL